jgi:hypothetical protein
MKEKVVYLLNENKDRTLLPSLPRYKDKKNLPPLMLFFLNPDGKQVQNMPFTAFVILPEIL